ncbi:hypothetical protein J11TS1_26550 [Oceanobacillus sp. J11TS1]|nr:hypothetical protein J11TS1_26550 [Oceanobacillus sp. J11TS1]
MRFTALHSCMLSFKDKGGFQVIQSLNGPFYKKQRLTVLILLRYTVIERIKSSMREKIQMFVNNF